MRLIKKWAITLCFITPVTLLVGQVYPDQIEEPDSLNSFLIAYDVQGSDTLYAHGELNFRNDSMVIEGGSALGLVPGLTSYSNTYNTTTKGYDLSFTDDGVTTTGFSPWYPGHNEISISGPILTISEVANEPWETAAFVTNIFRADNYIELDSINATTERLRIGTTDQFGMTVTYHDSVDISTGNPTDEGLMGWTYPGTGTYSYNSNTTGSQPLLFNDNLSTDGVTYNQSGNSIGISLSGIDVDSTNELQTLDVAQLVGTNLQLSLSDDGESTKIIGLSSLQDGNGYWTLTGNNIYYTTGDVGIGVASPSAKLDVLGDIEANGILRSISGNGVNIQADNTTVNTSGSAHLILGEQTAINMGGTANLAFGFQTKYNGSGNNNIDIGRSTGYNSGSLFGIHLGQEAGYNDDANYNIFLGYKANGSTTATTGHNNIGIGFEDLYSLTSGTENVSIGYQAGKYFNSDSYNTLLGSRAMGSTSADGTGNVALGYNAGNAMTGSYNVVGGFNAALNRATDRSVILGRLAGNASGTTNRCVFIGDEAGRYETSSYRIHIDGNSAYNTSPLFYGETDNRLAKINGNFETTGRIRVGDQIEGNAVNMAGYDSEGDLTRISLGTNIELSSGTLNVVGLEQSLGGAYMNDADYDTGDYPSYKNIAIQTLIDDNGDVNVNTSLERFEIDSNGGGFYQIFVQGVLDCDVGETNNLIEFYANVGGSYTLIGSVPVRDTNDEGFSINTLIELSNNANVIISMKSPTSAAAGINATLLKAQVIKI